MGEPLVITIPHKLGKEEALRRIKLALGDASQNFPVLKVEEEVWSEDCMDFRVRVLGQVPSGKIRVGDDNVRLEVTLPWLLHKFGEAVQTTIRGRGRALLEKRQLLVGLCRRHCRPQPSARKAIELNGRWGSNAECIFCRAVESQIMELVRGQPVEFR